MFCSPYISIDRGKAIVLPISVISDELRVILDKNLTYMIRKYAAELLNTVILRVRAFFKVI